MLTTTCLLYTSLEPLAEDEPKYAGFKKVFINPRIVEESGEPVKLEEGGLSIPGCLLYTSRCV